MRSTRATSTSAKRHAIVSAGPAHLVPAQLRGEAFPGACIEEIGSINLQDVVGDYAVPSDIAEWAWVEANAAFAHTNNGTDGVWEFVLNMARDFSDIPSRLVPAITEARAKNLSYLIIHQGT